MTSTMYLAARNLRLALASLLIVAMATGTSLAADAPSVPAPSPLAAQQPVEELQQLDEIWVRGKRLAQVIEDAEDAFFARYNKLNKDRNFDVRCGYVALSRDSMIMTRTCVPDFIATYATYYSPGMGSGNCHGSTSSGNWSTGEGCWTSGREVVPLSLLAMHYRQDYANNVLKVVHSDPQLLTMAGKLAVLYEDMELTRQRYVTVKPGRKFVRPAATPRAL
jgi:hypothetical protein